MLFILFQMLVFLDVRDEISNLIFRPQHPIETTTKLKPFFFLFSFLQMLMFLDVPDEIQMESKELVRSSYPLGHNTPLRQSTKLMQFFLLFV